MKEGSCSSEICSRGLSRVASAHIEEHILPVLRHYNEEFSESCPYASACYQRQEKTKREIRSDRFECGLCGKLFKSERYLDQHLDYRHNTKNDSNYCIADACSHLRCHDMPTPDSLSSEDRVRLARTRSERCDESVMQTRREICDAVASSCFASEILRDGFMEEYCVSLTCATTNMNTSPSLKRKLDIPESNQTIQNVLLCLVVFGILYYYLKLLFLKRRRMSADGLRVKMG